MVTSQLAPVPLVERTPPPERLALDGLSQIVTGLARAESLWRPHVAHDRRERVRRRLLATPAYEVWLLGWSPGQSVGLHDHGGANGAFVVVDGELVETAAVGGSLLDFVRGPGQLGRIPAGAVHDVANHSSSNATSIHAYSRPLSTMGFYADDGTLDRVEAVHHESPLVVATELDRVLRRATIGA